MEFTFEIDKVLQTEFTYEVAFGFFPSTFILTVYVPITSMTAYFILDEAHDIIASKLFRILSIPKMFNLNRFQNKLSCIFWVRLFWIVTVSPP